MKLSTHIITGASAAAMVAILVSGLSKELITSVVLAILINWLIDLGHVRGRYGPRRSAFTHSLMGVTAVSLIVYVAFYLIKNISPLSIDVDLTVLIAMEVCGLTHLFLDSLTEGGIYPLWPFSGRRYALAHIDYDDPIANSLAIIAFTLPTLYLLYMYRGVIGEWLVRLGLFR